MKKSSEMPMIENLWERQKFAEIIKSVAVNLDYKIIFFYYMGSYEASPKQIGSYGCINKRKL